MSVAPGTRSAALATVALTARGSRLAAILCRKLPAVGFVPSRFLDTCRLEPGASGPEDGAGDLIGYDEPVANLLRRLFPVYGGLIPVMAVGAAVRLLAPSLLDKRSDPAVVVLDDAGRFAVSLVSGHVGGANRLAERVAAILGATPVITTASESAGVPSPDLLGQEHGWRIEPGSALTTVAAALVNGDAVGVFQDRGDRSWLQAAPEHLTVHRSVSDLLAASPAAAILVSDRVFDLPDFLKRRTAVYRPPSLVLGIGCSSGATADEIGALLDATLAQRSLSILSVAAVATIDRKANEPGLRALVDARRWPLVAFPARELAGVAGDWSSSAVVLRAVGVGGVAEPAALRHTGVRELLVRKVKSARVTLAVARFPDHARPPIYRLPWLNEDVSEELSRG